jgi:hypothetical protein
VAPIPGVSTDFSNGDLARNPQLAQCGSFAKACNYTDRSFGLGYHVVIGPGGSPTSVTASRDNMGCAADFCYTNALKVQPLVHNAGRSIDVVCSFTR